MPQPKDIQLRLFRTGIWWFGFRESHRMRISAVPVTDRKNDGKPGNTVDLSGARWRILPLPGFLGIPILLLLFMLLSSGPREVSVQNPSYVGDSHTYWVVAPTGTGSASARLAWEASPFALLRLSGPGAGGLFVHSPREVHARFASGSREIPAQQYTVGPLLGWHGASA